jgi:hypothetical protein
VAITVTECGEAERCAAASMDETGERNGHADDLQRITRGLEVFVGLDFQQLRDHYATHEDDKLCDLTRADGKGMVPCTRDAIRAIVSIAERHVASLANPNDYSVSDLAEAMRRRLVRAMIEEDSDEAILGRVLREATEEVEKTHAERVFHFPCVLVSARNPEIVSLGPVEFRPLAAFMKARKESFEEYVGAGDEAESSKAWVERFEKYSESYGWIASVRIPSCATANSQARAETVAGTAINLIRLFLGAGHARDMRLAHSFSSSPANYDFVVETRGKFDLWATRKMPGAIVDDTWCDAIRTRGPEFWFRSARLLEAATRERVSEMASRIVDGLSWFEEASFEPSLGKQIAKFEAALERLTVTGRFALHSFCAHTALLARDGVQGDVEECYWKAFDIHIARSQVVHGLVSAGSPVFRKSLQLAHELTRTALFRGIEMQSYLDGRGTPSTRKSLDDFYNKEMSPYAKVFSRLRKELNLRHDALRKSKN